MTGSPARPDLRAYGESLRLHPDELVTRLRVMLGAKLVAYLASLSETRTVRAWADGSGAPPSVVEARLRVAYRLALLLSEKDAPEVVQAWFQGVNEHLGDRVPARLLRDGDLADFEQALVAAARDFKS